MSFPKNFTWGAATASYQIEGAAYEDSKGQSVWDMFCRKEGAIFSNHNGDVACDHYHRWKEDVAIMKSIGINGYRFSVSWPRVIPGGTGAVNEKGLAFYDRLVDEMLSAGVEPWLTLFHWDYPYDLYCRGGWLNDDSPQWFADYAGVLADRLSDRVGNWMTFTEPQCFLNMGHSDGTHAPGLKLSFEEVMRAVHRAMMAQGRAVQTIRARAKRKPNIGWAPVGHITIPNSEKPQDIEQARQITFASAGNNLWNNTIFADPVFFGHYPEDALRLMGKNAPKVKPGDMELINQRLDFYGLNIYRGRYHDISPDGQKRELPYYPGHPMTTNRWMVTPDVLYWGPKFIYERYKVPIVQTENGLCNNDWISMDGRCHDPQRIDFTRRYLLALERAIDEGVDIRGYFQWSLMDNFEWAEGYAFRFGLVHVDYQTQKRTLKDSAHWYSKVIQTNGRSLRDEVNG